MTHTAEPMTLAKLSADIDKYEGGVVGVKRLCKWKAAIDAGLAKQREANTWYAAVTNACVVNHIDWNENDAEESLAKLVEWEVSMALDPRVSNRARALISCYVVNSRGHLNDISLYTHPQQRNAVEVTDEMVESALKVFFSHKDGYDRMGMRAALETALSAVAPRDREDAEHMDAKEQAQFVSTIDDFDDDGETSTDYEVLMRWERMGLLECERFLITQQGRKLFDDAARRENKP